VVEESPPSRTNKLIGADTLNCLLNYRRLLILASQICLLAMSYYGSFLLRFDFHPDVAYQSLFVWTLPLVVAVELVFYVDGGATRG
jgi:hypothetical protein